MGVLNKLGPGGVQRGGGTVQVGGNKLGQRGGNDEFARRGGWVEASAGDQSAGVGEDYVDGAAWGGGSVGQHAAVPEPAG
jgi:hypothetical protein